MLTQFLVSLSLVNESQLTGEAMKSSIMKRSIVVAGHKTSVSLEDPFWSGLKEIAKLRGATVAQLVASVDSDRRDSSSNLSSSIRLFVLDHYQNQCPIKQPATQPLEASGSAHW